MSHDAFMCAMMYSHVPYELCHVETSHAKYAHAHTHTHTHTHIFLRVMVQGGSRSQIVSYINAMHHGTCEYVINHVTSSHEWCHTFHVPHVNESCHTSEWVTSHIWIIHVTHINESCHTYEWVTGPRWRRRIYGHTSGFWRARTDTNES